MDVFTQSAAGLVNQTFNAAFNPPANLYGADLYTGTDPSSLNILERAWMQWYIYFNNPVIATGVMSFLLHEVSEESIMCLIQWRRA